MALVPPDMSQGGGLGEGGGGGEEWAGMPGAGGGRLWQGLLE